MVTSVIRRVLAAANACNLLWINSRPRWKLADTPRDDHHAHGQTREKNICARHNYPDQHTPIDCRPEGPVMVAASREAALRDYVGRPVSISVSQSPHKTLVGNPNPSFSEFDWCLPDLGSPSPFQLHKHGMDTSITPRLAKIFCSLALPRFQSAVLAKLPRP